MDSFWLAWSTPSVPPNHVFLLLVFWAIFQYRVTSLLQKRKEPGTRRLNYILLAFDVAIVAVLIWAVVALAGAVR